MHQHSTSTSCTCICIAVQSCTQPSIHIGDVIEVSAQWSPPYQTVAPVPTQSIRYLKGKRLTGWSNTNTNYDAETVHFLHPCNPQVRFIGKVIRTGKVSDFPSTIVQLEADYKTDQHNQQLQDQLQKENKESKAEPPRKKKPKKTRRRQQQQNKDPKNNRRAPLAASQT